MINGVRERKVWPKNVNVWGGQTCKTTQEFYEDKMDKRIAP